MLEFTLDRATFPVKIEGEEYAVVELTGTERDAYLNSLGKKVRMSEGKAQGVNNFGGIQSGLISRSLYKCRHEGEGENIKCVDLAEKPVAEDTCKDWPSSVQNALFAKAQELSGLGDKKRENKEEGND